jgi:hypothetical protein
MGRRSGGFLVYNIDYFRRISSCCISVAFIQRLQGPLGVRNMRMFFLHLDELPGTWLNMVKMNTCCCLLTLHELAHARHTHCSHLLGIC